MKTNSPFACLECGNTLRQGVATCGKCGKDLVDGGETKVIGFAIPVKSSMYDDDESNSQIATLSFKASARGGQTKPVLEIATGDQNIKPVMSKRMKIVVIALSVVVGFVFIIGIVLVCVFLIKTPDKTAISGTSKAIVINIEPTKVAIVNAETTKAVVVIAGPTKTVTKSGK